MNYNLGQSDEAMQFILHEIILADWIESQQKRFVEIEID